MQFKIFSKFVTNFEENVHDAGWLLETARYYRSDPAVENTTL
jgi:hypothetical protein